MIDAFAPPSADGFLTSSVQVQGQNFEAGLSVVFGSESPTPTNVTPTSFDVVVGPQALGNASVVVTNPNGETGGASYPFVAVTPAITDFSPDEVQAGAVETVLVTGQNFAPGISVSFGSQNPTPTNVTTTSFEVSVGPQPEGVVSVVVTHPNGNASTPVNFTFQDFASRWVFVTSTTANGDDYGGIAGADAICNSRASSAGLIGTFKAWLSDSTSSPSTTFVQSIIPYLRTDGVQVADDWADLVDGTLDAPIAADEFGVAATGTVRTGTLGDGTADPAAEFCGDWSNTTGSTISGRADLAAGGTWSNNATHACSAFLKLYCFEQ